MSEHSLSNNSNPVDQKLKLALHKELLVIWICGWTVLITCYVILGFAWEWGPSNQWFLQSALLLGLVYYLTFRRIGLNRPSLQASLYAGLGWANRLTLLRGGLIAMTGGFIFLKTPPNILAWAPGIFYTIAAIIDRLDGYVARKGNHQSLLGNELDTLLDALGLVIAPLLAVWYGQIHWSYLLVSCAYYLFHWGIVYRRQHGLPVYELKPSLSRRAIAGYQMGFIAVALWPLFRPPVTTIAGIAFMLPLMIGFAIDWFIVSGRIDLESPNITRIFNSLESISQSVFQPILRILVLVLMSIIIAGSNEFFIPVKQSELLSTILVYVTILTASLILLGIAGRLSALVLVLLLGFHYLTSPVGMIDVILLFSVIWVMLLGTGRYSLWQWDEDWVNRYDGT